MAENSQKDQKPEEYGSDYELMSHKDILELREELRKLKMHPNEKTLQLSMVELAAKVDKLIDIFSEAMHEIRIEEGGLTFQDKMKPLVDRMDKVLEQNSQIAEGLVAVAELVNEMKDMTGGAPSRKLPDINFNRPPSRTAPPPNQQRPPTIPPLPPPPRP